MNVDGFDHVYRVVPDWRGNKELPADEQIVFELKAVSQAAADELEIDEARISAKREETTKKFEMIQAARREIVKRHFVAVHNLVVAGKAIDGWEDFYARGPKVLVGWVSQLVSNEDLLSEHDIKN